jgi:uncharacterized Tic20 family protein
MPAVSRDEYTLGMLAHVLQIFTWLIGPVLILLIRRDSKFVRYHAMQVVLFQLLVVIVWVASFAALVAGAVLGAARHDEPGGATLALPILFMLLFGVGGALTWFLNLVLGVVYGLRANNGEWAGYPGIKYLAAKVAGVELP